MMKKATNNTINSPSEGWFIDEYGKMTIDYFDGNPFSKDITDIVQESDDDTDFQDLIHDSADESENYSENESEDD